MFLSIVSFLLSKLGFPTNSILDNLIYAYEHGSSLISALFILQSAARRGHKSAFSCSVFKV